MLWRDNQLPKISTRKHKNVITVGLRNTWPEITEDQRLDQNHKENNRHQKNLRNRFWRRKPYLRRKKTAS